MSIVKNIVVMGALFVSLLADTAHIFAQSAVNIGGTPDTRHGHALELSGAPEFEFRNIHNVFKADGSVDFEPVEKCILPPPQPFWMFTSLNFWKAVLTTYLLWSSVTKMYSQKDWIIFWCVAVYQGVVTIFSLVSTLKRVLFDMGPFNSTWDHYQCFGIVVCLAPWAPNALIVFGKYFAINEGADMDDEGFLEGADSFEDQRMVKTKNRYLLMTFGTLMSTCALLNIGFIFTHLLVGFFVFLPETFLILAVGFGLWILMSYLEGRYRVAKYGGSMGIPNTKEGCDFKMNMTVITTMPAVLALTVLGQVVALQSTYWYGGLSWMSALKVVWEERQAHIYFGNMWQKVFSDFPWRADFINEAS